MSEQAIDENAYRCQGICFGSCGQGRGSSHVILQRDIFQWCRRHQGSLATQNHSNVVIECQLVFEPIPRTTLIKGNVTFKQFKVERYMKSVPVGCVDGGILHNASDVVAGLNPKLGCMPAC